MTGTDAVLEDLIDLHCKQLKLPGVRSTRGSCLGRRWKRALPPESSS